MNDFSKKGNRSNIHKFEKCILSSQKQRLRKTKKVQKALKALCDEDDNSDCFENSLFVVRSMQKAHNTDHYVKQDTNLASQKNILEERLIESFSESSSASSEQDQYKRSKKYQKTKSIGRQNSNSEVDSKLAMNRKCKSKKNRISDDSDDNSLDILLNKTAKQKYKKSKRIKSKSNNYINFNSESENDSINETSNISKSLPKHTMHQKKEKIANSYTLTKDKSKKHDSSNESEDDDIEYMKQKKSSINTLHDDKNEQKHKNHGKSLKRRFCEIQKDDSDTGSGKEFQKIKIQNVHSDKYSKKQLVNLEIDRQKLVDLENEKSEKSIDEQTILDFDEAKEILKECKKICLNFVMYVDSAEQLYGKMEEQFLLKSTEKINKLNMVLEKKQKSLTTFYQSLSERSKTKKNIAIKKLHKTITDKEQFSADSEAINVDKEQSASENKCSYRNEQESKDVSECDSEEIFSADEMRTPQKKQTTVDKKSRTNDLDNVNVEVDEDKMLMDKSQNNNNNMDLQDEESSSVNSPVLGTSEEKRIRTENTKSIEKQLFSENVDSNNKEVQLTDKDTDSKDKLAKLSTTNIYDEIISENSSVKDDNKKMTLQNDEQNKCTNEVDIVNQSLDLFETYEGEKNEIETQKTDTEINCKKTKSLSRTKDSLDAYETSLQNKISNEKNNTSILNNKGEKDLLNQNNQKEMVSISAIKDEIYDSSKEIDTFNKMNFNVESDSEILAKKALLESDSDTSSNTVVNIKQTKDLNTNLKNEAGDNYSDVSSNTSTIVLSTFTKSNDDIESKAEVTDASEKNQFDKKFSKENETSQTSDETNAKREQVAKKALLESSSSSDSSSIVHSLSIQSLLSESEEIDPINKLNISKENSEAKMAHLASSNSESFSSEFMSTTASETEISISKETKNYDTDSDEKSLISRIKKKKLKLSKNRHYKKDKKLKMFCEVRLEKLNKNILKQYSHALKESKEYLEQKAFESLVNLDRLEKRYKRNKKIDSNTSRNDDKTFASSTISKSINKQKRNQTTKEESLMDHLKKIENDEVSAIVRTDSSSDESLREVKDINSISNEALMSEANEVAREFLLRSSDSDTGKDVLNSDESINNDDANKSEDKKKKNQKKSNKTSKQDNDKKEKNDRSSWRQDKLLRMKFFDTDSDIEKKKWDKKQEKMAKESEKNSSDSDDEKKCLMSKKKKIKRRILDSDSDVKLTDCSSDSDISEISKNKQNSSDQDIKKENQKRKRRKRGESNSSGTDSSFQEKKVKPKRKRIKKMASDSDSSDEDVKNSQGSTPVKSGRKNIRKVLKDKQVAEDTKLAAKEEEERLKRIAERQALYNEVYEMRLAGEKKVDKLVLDFDTETKEELVSIHKELVKRLKPHQAQGIKFMWDACFESLERVKTTSGSGCIIAHCMGLGKSLQVVALTHALLTHETTNVKTVLIVCPLSTVLNWLNEYNTWLKDLDDIDVYELTKYKKNFERKYQLQNWQKTGGVMIIGYEMFRNLTGPNKNIRKAMKEVISECLVDPGADVIVCDEGHLLKNEDTALSKCMRRVKTMRRIVLTGTPLQNNLIEYHCMVQFVKPNLLGTKKEFLNRFVNPITNGQFDDSTAYDVKLMKKRAHVLHKMLEGSVQRFDYSVLTPFLPPKQEYVIFVRLTDTQINMYQYYLDNLARRHHSGAGGTLFADFQALQRIWTHPVVLRLNAERIEKANEKKGFSTDTEGSLKDFINDDTTDSSNSSSSNSNSDSDVQAIDDIKKNVSRRKTRNNPGVEEPEEENKENKENKEENISTSEIEWWSQFVQPEHFKDIRVSAKLLLLFGILKECEQIGDKVLVFSQSLYSLTLIEEFLARIDDETQNNTSLDILDNHSGSWSLGLDYFRLDGQTSAENRSIWCKIFNKPTNTRARLFLISTRAGGLGINLTAANRVIIFDASWNPSHDVQSIFRIYRFGQKKPCYVYRFLAAGTMEEKIYNRQVTKLSLSCRVVDEQQIERHYSNHNLNELYTFEPYSEENRPTLNLPKDRLLAEIFLKYKNVVENYHEHDSLLENKAEEELDEEERKQAWLEYEEEKKGKPLMNPMNNPTYQNNILLQQYNMMINSGQPSMISQGMSLQMEYENLQQLIRKDYPNATPEQQKNMTNRALMEMYNYWEKQATLCQPVRNLATASTNFQQRSMTIPHTVINSNVHQTQLNQLLTSGQAGNYVNKSVQPNMTQRDLISNAFRNVSSINKTGKADDDIIEVPTTSNTSTLSAQVAIQSTSKSNNQEE